MESAKSTISSCDQGEDKFDERVSTKERMLTQAQSREGSHVFGEEGEQRPADGLEECGPCDEEDVCERPDGLEDDGRAEEESEDFEGMSPRELGLRGEEAACELLKRRGYDILERNWTCFAGEADLIARDEDGTLVFVEVKTRSNVEFGLPSDAVTPQKRARYERIAGCFLSEYDGDECRVRFDVISILALPNKRALVRHYVNAFGSGC